MSRQKSRPGRIILIAVLLIVLVPVAAVAIFVASFNPDSYKPEIIAAVERSTGRQLTITGPLHLSLSLVPTISASGISLANPPGYPDATMATLNGVQAQVALLPLLSHHIDIIKLVLLNPAITLEYGPTGTPNWIFASPAPAAAGQSGNAPARPVQAHRGRAHSIALQSVSIENGTITYKPQASLAPLKPGAITTQSLTATGAPTTITIAHFTGHATALDAPLHVTMQATYNGAPFSLAGTTGPVARFSQNAAGGNAAGGQPWPIDLSFGAASAQLQVKGTIAHPRQVRGYALALDAHVPNLADLDPYARGVNLPPLRSVVARADITQSESSPIPAITNASLRAGASDLGTWRKTLSVSSLNVTMASLDQTIDIAMAGQYQGRPVGLEGSAGPLAPIIAATLSKASPAQPDKPQPDAPLGSEHFGVNLAAKIGNASFGLAGGIARPQTLAGVALKITARIPNLAHLSDLAGTALPAWTNIGLSGLLTDPGNQGLDHAIGLNSLAVSADQGQFGGAFRLTPGLVSGPTPDLQAVINAPRIDLTALLAALPKPAQTASSTQPLSATPAAPQQPTAATVIPASPLPFNLLRRGNGNIELTIGELMYDGATYDAIDAHALLNNGVLTVRPISAELPGGSVTGTLHVDATANPPQVRITEAAPAFRLAPLLTLLHLPNAAGATVQLYADLSGEGNTRRDIAATLNGSIGLSTVNGEIDGALLNKLFGASLDAAGLPANVVGSQGPVSVRCFAARADAKNGLATLSALTLDSSRLYLTGTGSFDLGAERLNLILRPQVQFGGATTPVPVALRGTFEHPRAGPAPPGAYDATVASLARRLGHNGGTVLGRFAQQLGIVAKPPAPQSCRTALALARFGHAGPAPNAPSPGAASPPAAQSSGPQNLLQSLFH